MTLPAGGKRWPPRSCGLVLSTCLLAFSPASAAEDTPEKTEPPGIAVQLTFADGKNVEGMLEKLSESGLSLRGNAQPIALWEIHELRIGSKTPGKAVNFSTGPLVAFRSGEKVLGRITDIGNGDNSPFATISLGAKLPLISGQLAGIAAFRLREKYAGDPVFEETLEGAPPEQDVFFLRRSGLLSVAGVFHGIDKDYLQVEVAGKRSRVRRQLVHGVILAPIASSMKETDPPTRLEIPGVGQLPVYLRGLERAKDGPLLLFRLPYSQPGRVQKIPLSAIARILPASDKIVFLSSLEPTRVEEAAVLGRAFPYRKNLSVSGAPLRLNGRTYRRGLGVHSRTLLEYALNAGYKTFAALLGIDDSSRGKGSVTFILSADGKELLRENFDSKREPLPISFPVSGVKRLTLLVDYGNDQLDRGDHADWLNARLTR